jgi:copper chaperone CopZ
MNCITGTASSCVSFTLKLSFMKEYTFNITGMGGDHCVNVIKTILSKQPGVTINQVEVGKAIFSIDESVNSKENTIAAIEKMGYKVID